MIFIIQFFPLIAGAGSLLRLKNQIQSLRLLLRKVLLEPRLWLPHQLCRPGRQADAEENGDGDVLFWPKKRAGRRLV